MPALFADLLNLICFQPENSETSHVLGKNSADKSDNLLTVRGRCDKTVQEDYVYLRCYFDRAGGFNLLHQQTRIYLVGTIFEKLRLYQKIAIFREGSSLKNNTAAARGWNDMPSRFGQKLTRHRARKRAERAEAREMRKNRTPGEKRRAKQQLGISMAFVSPSLLGVLVFFVVPFVVVIYYAFVNNPVLHEFVGFSNFRNLLQNHSFQLAAKNTAVFSLISVPSAVALSLLLACMLSQKLPLRSQFRTSMLSPLMVPVASVVLIWQVIFSYNGVLNEIVARFGVEKIDWMKSDFNRYVVILLFLWKNVGYNMILFLTALANVPVDLQEMAMLEGAGSARIFFSIKLRYLSPTILFVTILSLINSMKIFREVYLLTGKYPYEGLYLLQHFMNNTFENLDYQKLSSAALLMALVMVFVIWLLFVADDRLGKDVEGE